MRTIPPWMDGIPFTIAQGRDAGFTYDQMRGGRFERPFHGVRVAGSSGRIDGGRRDLCEALRAVLPAGFVFSHATAAQLWGMPLPSWMDDALHVTGHDAAAVRRPGVIGWRRTGGTEHAVLVDGLAVSTPAETWVTLATMTRDRGGAITREWLVAIGDFLISGRRTKFGRDPALATREELADAISRHGSRRGAVALAWAFERVRSPVDSPYETFLRLGLVAARLPEPAVQPEIMTAVGIRHPDLGFIAQKVLLEYLGDVHRVDRATWLRDLERVQLFEDAGYRVILVGAADVTPEGMRALSERVRRALRRRS